MRTILAKVLLWSLGTLALSLVAYGAIERALQRHGPPDADPFWRMVSLVEDETCRAFEEGGREGLKAHLRRLDAKVPGEHLLTDARGVDLAEGTDRAALLKEGPGHAGPLRLPDGRMVLVGRPRDGRYRFITLVQPWFEPPNILPYFAVVVLVIALMGTALAVHLAVPLRRLRRVVMRFGGGDLSARSRSRRGDEIGELSRSVDEMADRIETLVTAERRLLQDVSHELRSPLTRLDVAIDLAIKREDRGPLLRRIRRDVTRLSDLVGELLDLTRAEGDPAARVLEAVRLEDLLRTLVEDCSIEAEAKGCRLAYQASWPGSMRGDPELLRRAFENVIRNAIRHAPEGTSIEVSLASYGQGAKVIVRDFGPGVPAEALASIFEPFFRVEGDRSRGSGGVGLGLAIARRSIAIHGGHIEARNAEPGLAVEIVLPGS